MKKSILLVLPFLFVGCAGNFTSQVTPGFVVPTSDRIAVSYLDHANTNISNSATAILESQLERCQQTNLIKAAEVDSILRANKIEFPRRISEDFVRSLKPVLNAKYLLTGGVLIWTQGAPGFPMATATDVSATFSMYDLETGKVAWSVTGQEKGADGIFAEKPEQKAKVVFSQMLRKWQGFCNLSPAAKPAKSTTR